MGALKRALYSGTFDPIHFGHINLAIHMLEQNNLDEVLICPTAISPFKAKSPPSASAEARYAMCMAAFEGIPGCRVIADETEQERVHYTVDTLEALTRRYPDDALYLIVSEEAFSSITKWKDYERILALAHPLIGKRFGDATLDMPNEEINRIFQEGRQKNPVYEVCATTIRQRIREKRYCGHMTSSKVLDYISRYRLYC